MDTRKLAKQALRYLATLQQDSASYPDDSDTRFYNRVERDYQALKTLNDAGLGATDEDLEKLANQLTPKAIDKVVSELKRLDKAIAGEYSKEEALNTNPAMWKNFFSGYESIPTAACERALKSIELRLSRYSQKQAKLFKSITMEQAEEHGYITDGMFEEDFM